MEENKYIIKSIIFLIIIFISGLTIGFVAGKNSVNTYDANRDGKINVCDAVTIIKYIREEDTEE